MRVTITCNCGQKITGREGDKGICPKCGLRWYIKTLLTTERE